MVMVAYNWKTYCMSTKVLFISNCMVIISDGSSNFKGFKQYYHREMDECSQV